MQKMINFDDATKEIIKEDNPNRPQISDYPYRILKVQSCLFYTNKYMIASTQIANTEIFTSLAVLVFKLLSCKVLFMNRNNNRNC